MVLAREATISVNPVSSVIKGAILSAFSLLSALALRDSFMKTLEAVLPDNAKEKLIFVYFYASVVVLITVLLAYLWNTNSN